MPENAKDSPASRIVPGPAHLRHYPAHHLVAWQPHGVLDDRLLDEIAEWLCIIEKAGVPFKRFVDLSRLTNVAIRTSHVFKFARRRGKEFAGIAPVRSALFGKEWVRFGIAQLYETLMENTPIHARAFRKRSEAAIWLDVPAAVLNLHDRPSAP